LELPPSFALVQVQQQSFVVASSMPSASARASSSASS
jgi:hypothetical protein